MYSIVTELEKQRRTYDTIEDAITAAEAQGIRGDWEIRDEDTDEAVYTHYTED